MCSGQQQTHKQNCWQYIRLKRSYIRGLENCCRKDKLKSLSPAVSVVHQSQRHSPCILLHDSIKRKNTQTNKHWQPKHSQPRIYLVVWSTTFCLTDRQTDRQTRWKQYNIMNMSRKMRCLKIALFKVGLSSIVSAHRLKFVPQFHFVFGHKLAQVPPTNTSPLPLHATTVPS